MKRFANQLIFIMTVLCLCATDLYSEGYKFQEHDNAAREMKGYYDRASQLYNKEEWRTVVEQGKSRVMAEWEEEAQKEIEKAVAAELAANPSAKDTEIREGINALFITAKELLGEKIDAAIDNEQAEWLADVIEIVEPYFDRESLRNIISESGTVKYGESIGEAFTRWDTDVMAVYNAIFNLYVNGDGDTEANDENKGIEEQRTEILNRIDELVGESVTARQIFITTLDARLKDIKEDRDRNERIFIIRERNNFFYTQTQDTESIRLEAEKQSAQAITRNIIEDTEHETDRQMESALYIDGEALEPAPMSVTTEEYQQKMQAVVDAGVASWQRAEQNFLAARLDWERRSLDAFDRSNEVWQSAYDEFKGRREEWYRQIRAQIIEGNEIWAARVLEVDKKFQDAQDELNDYINNQRGSWDDYSENFRQMIVSGSSAVSTAAENLSWLKDFKMELEKSTDPAMASLKKNIEAQIANWESLIQKFNQKLLSAEIRYHYIDMNGEQFSTGEFTPGEFTSQYTILKDPKVPTSYFPGRMDEFKELYDLQKGGQLCADEEWKSFNAFVLLKNQREYGVMSQFLAMLMNEYGAAIKENKAIGSLFVSENYEVYLNKLSALTPYTGDEGKKLLEDTGAKLKKIYLSFITAPVSSEWFTVENNLKAFNAFDKKYDGINDFMVQFHFLKYIAKSGKSFEASYGQQCIGGEFIKHYPTVALSYFMDRMDEYKKLYDLQKENNLCTFEKWASFKAIDLPENQREYGIMSQFLILLMNEYGAAIKENKAIDSLFGTEKYQEYLGKLSALPQYADGAGKKLLENTGSKLNKIYLSFIMAPVYPEWFADKAGKDKTNLDMFNAYDNRYAGINDFMLKFHFLKWTEKNNKSFEAAFGKKTTAINAGLFTDGSVDKDGNPVYKGFTYKSGDNVIINGEFGINNDPYLLTKAEYDLEILKIEKDYWSERLERARRVKEYAEAVKKMDAAEQKAALEAARTSYNNEKQKYQDAVNKLAKDVSGALDLAKDEMQTAGAALERSREAFTRSQKEYESVMSVVYTLQSPEAMQLAQEDMSQAAARLVELNNLIEGKERAWLQEAGDYYGLLAVRGLSEEARAYAARLKSAIEIYLGAPEKEVAGGTDTGGTTPAEGEDNSASGDAGTATPADAGATTAADAGASTDGTGADVSSTPIGYARAYDIIQNIFKTPATGIESIGGENGIIGALRKVEAEIRGAVSDETAKDSGEYIAEGKTKIEDAFDSLNARVKEYKGMQKIMGPDAPLQDVVLELFNRGSELYYLAKNSDSLPTDSFLTDCIKNMLTAEKKGEGTIEFLRLSSDTVSVEDINRVLGSSDSTETKTQKLKELFYTGVVAFFPTSAGIDGIIDGITGYMEPLMDETVGEAGTNGGQDSPTIETSDVFALIKGILKADEINAVMLGAGTIDAKKEKLKGLILKGLIRAYEKSESVMDISMEEGAFDAYVRGLADDEEYERTLSLKLAAIDVRNAVTGARDTAGKIYSYLLNDMKKAREDKTLDASPFTLENISKSFSSQADGLTLGITRNNLDQGTAVKELFDGTNKDEPGVYSRLIEKARENIDASQDETTFAKNIAIYNFLKGMRPTILDAEKNIGKINPAMSDVTFDGIAKEMNDMLTALRDVDSMYTTDVYTAASDKRKEKITGLIEKYQGILESGKITTDTPVTDDAGNPLIGSDGKQVFERKITETERKKYQALAAELVNPGSFDMFTGLRDKILFTSLNENDVTFTLMTYATNNYDNSFEKRERRKQEGAAGIVSRVLGFGEKRLKNDLIAAIEKGKLNYTTLADYGSELTDYMRGSEFGQLPESLRKAIQEAAGRYQTMLAARALCDYQNIDPVDLEKKAETARVLAEKAAAIVEGYNKLFNIKSQAEGNKVYDETAADEEIENPYTILMEQYYEQSPYGTFTGGIDDMLKLLGYGGAQAPGGDAGGSVKTLTAMYQELQAEIEKAQLPNGYAFPLAALCQSIKELRYEYEIIYYTERYLRDDQGMTLDAYRAKLVGTGENGFGKESAFADEVKKRIQKQIVKRQIIDDLDGLKNTGASNDFPATPDATAPEKDPLASDLEEYQTIMMEEMGEGVISRDELERLTRVAYLDGIYNLADDGVDEFDALALDEEYQEYGLIVHFREYLRREFFVKGEFDTFDSLYGSVNDGLLGEKFSRGSFAKLDQYNWKKKESFIELFDIMEKVYYTEVSDLLLSKNTIKDEDVGTFDAKRKLDDALLHFTKYAEMHMTEDSDFTSIFGDLNSTDPNAPGFTKLAVYFGGQPEPDSEPEAGEENDEGTEETDTTYTLKDNKKDQKFFSENAGIFQALFGALRGEYIPFIESALPEDLKLFCMKRDFFNLNGENAAYGFAFIDMNNFVKGYGLDLEKSDTLAGIRGELKSYEKLVRYGVDFKKSQENIEDYIEGLNLEKNETDPVQREKKKNFLRLYALDPALASEEYLKDTSGRMEIQLAGYLMELAVKKLFNSITDQHTDATLAKMRDFIAESDKTKKELNNGGTAGNENKQTTVQELKKRIDELKKDDSIDKSEGSTFNKLETFIAALSDSETDDAAIDRLIDFIDDSSEKTEGGIIDRLVEFGEGFARDESLKNEALLVLKNGKKQFRNYRDFIELTKKWFEEQRDENRNDNLTAFEKMIVAAENLEKVNSELNPAREFEFDDKNQNGIWDIDEEGRQYTEPTAVGCNLVIIPPYPNNKRITLNYFKDSNDNDTWDWNQTTKVKEDYLGVFVQQYRWQGKGLVIEKRTFNPTTDSLDTVQSDVMHDPLQTLTYNNTLGYYLDEVRDDFELSFLNNMLEEMTQFNGSLLKIMAAAKMESGNLADMKLYKQDGTVYTLCNGGDFGETGVYDIYRLVSDVNSAFDNNIDAATGMPTNKSLRDAFAVIERAAATGNKGLIDEAIDEAVGEKSTVETGIAKAKETIVNAGRALGQGSLDEFMNSNEYINAKKSYEERQTELETQETNYNSRTKDYQKVQDDYINQLEVISILYGSLENARRDKEAEEAVYEYAATSYLYGSSTDADGGNASKDGAPADAREEFEAVEKEYNKKLQEVAEQEVKVKKVKEQNVWSDKEYKEIADELKEKADRAYRLEKLRVSMAQEIEKRAQNLDVAMKKYENSKDAFLKPTGVGKIGKSVRDSIIDKLTANDYFNRRLKDDLTKGALYINRYAMNYAGFDRIFDTDFWFTPHPDEWKRDGEDARDWFLGGGANSPIWEYLDNTRDGNRIIFENGLINSYFTNYLNHRESYNRYGNLMIIFGKEYGMWKPLHQKLERLKKKSFVGYILARTFYYASGMFLHEMVLEGLTYKVRKMDEKQSRAKKNADNCYNQIAAQLAVIQKTKLEVLKAQEKLANLTQLESLNDPLKAGSFAYTDPTTGQTSDVKKNTIKQAYEEIARQYGFTLKESDFDYIIPNADKKEIYDAQTGAALVEETDTNGVVKKYREVYDGKDQKTAVKIAVNDCYDEDGVLLEKYKTVYDVKGNALYLPERKVKTVYDADKKKIAVSECYNEAGVLKDEYKNVFDANGQAVELPSTIAELSTLAAKRRYLDAGKILGEYADWLEKDRAAVFTKYIEHTEKMKDDAYEKLPIELPEEMKDDTYKKLAGGYDDTVIDRARAELLYGIAAEWTVEMPLLEKKNNYGTLEKVPVIEDGIDYSAASTGRGYRGYIRAMGEYLGALEGFQKEDFAALEDYLNNNKTGEFLLAFKKFADMREGVNDRELRQKRELQQKKWELKRNEFIDKKADWDNKINAILARGVRQWTNMDESFDQNWKQWKRDQQDKLILANAAWSGKWEELQGKKEQWIASLSQLSGEADLADRVAELNDYVNGLIAGVNSEYGDIIDEVDLNEILKETITETPALVPAALMDAVKNMNADFALTEFSRRDLSGGRAMLCEYDDLMDVFKDEAMKTQNLRLMQAMVKVLESIHEKIMEIDRQGEQRADDYAASNDYSREGEHYVKDVGWRSQEVNAYRHYSYDRSRIVSDKTIENITKDAMALQAWQFNLMFNVQMREIESNFYRMIDPTNPEGVVYHIGSVNGGFIDDGGKKGTYLNSHGELGRLRDRFDANDDENTSYDLVMEAQRLVGKMIASYYTAGTAAIALSVLEAVVEAAENAAYNGAEIDEAAVSIVVAGAIAAAASGAGQAAGTAAEGMGEAAVKFASAAASYAVNTAGGVISSGLKYKHGGKVDFYYTEADQLNLAFMIGSGALNLTMTNAYGSNWLQGGVNALTSMLQNSMQYDEYGNLKGFKITWQSAVRGATVFGATAAQEFVRWAQNGFKMPGEQVPWDEKSKKDDKPGNIAIRPEDEAKIVAEKGSLEYYKEKQKLGYAVEITEKNDGSTIVTDTTASGRRVHIVEYKNGQKVTESQTKYIEQDGKMILDYNVMYRYKGNGDIEFDLNIFDGSGTGAYTKNNYLYDAKSQTTKLNFSEQWMLGSDGNIITDQKQYIYDTRMNNPLGPQIRDFNGRLLDFNTIGVVGCKVTASAILLSYILGQNITPPMVDAAMDASGAYPAGKTGLFTRDIVKAYGLNYEIKMLADMKTENFIKTIDDNIKKNTPMMVLYQKSDNETHYVVIGGARYDDKGNITHYLVRDVGWPSAGQYASVRYLDRSTLLAPFGPLWGGYPVRQIEWFKR